MRVQLACGVYGGRDGGPGGALGPWGDWIPKSQVCSRLPSSCLIALPETPGPQAQVLSPGSCGPASLLCFYQKSQALWWATSCLCSTWRSETGL